MTDESNEVTAPSWILRIIIGIIFSALSGLFIIKAGSSEVATVKEDVKENKLKIEKVEQCIIKTDKTLVRVETILERVEKVLDK